MLKIKINLVRSAVHIPWYFECVPTPLVLDYRKHFHEKFVLSGKSIPNPSNLSQDQLTIHLDTRWRSRRDFHEYMTDKICYQYRLTSIEYNTVNGIVSTIISVEDTEDD